MSTKMPSVSVSRTRHDAATRGGKRRPLFRQARDFHFRPACGFHFRQARDFVCRQARDLIFRQARVCTSAILLALLLVTLAGPRRASAQESVWQQRNPDRSPPPRYSHGMAYDSARGVTVVFGGLVDRGNGYDGETWEGDGAIWRLRQTTGPSPRTSPALAYDSARSVTVLFGGYGGWPRGDTWEWDGSAWTLRATTGPALLWLHAMAYDSRRGVTVLFGGEDEFNNIDSETWEWDGSAWELRGNTGPSPRYLHAMAYDSRRGVTVLFGGYARARNGETWEWDGETWTLRATTGPSRRGHHSMSYDSARGVTVLFGGYDNDGYVGDTWEWDGTAWTMSGAPGPSPRKEHAQAYDSARGVTVLFGGFDGSKYGDTWEYRGCSGRERLKKPTCLDQQGTNQLKVLLTGGIVGDGVTVALTDGSTVSCFLNARGKCRAFFNERPSGDSGEVVAAWGCGASDQQFYECP